MRRVRRGRCQRRRKQRRTREFETRSRKNGGPASDVHRRPSELSLISRRLVYIACGALPCTYSVETAFLARDTHTRAVLGNVAPRSPRWRVPTFSIREPRSARAAFCAEDAARCVTGENSDRTVETRQICRLMLRLPHHPNDSFRG